MSERGSNFSILFSVVPGSQEQALMTQWTGWDQWKSGPGFGAGGLGERRQPEFFTAGVGVLSGGLCDGEVFSVQSAVGGLQEAFLFCV